MNRERNRMGDRERRVTEQIERDELTRGQIGPGETPSTPVPASTIVLAREPRGGAFEVLLLRRPSAARFAAGAYVFPGGKIDEADADPELVRRLGRAVGGSEPAALAAAIRELFEETGLLLADAQPDRDSLAGARAALLAGESDFRSVAHDLDLSFDSVRSAYFGRWVTPTRFSRRYDTRFFITVVPEDRADFEPDLTDELAGFTWLEPSVAVEQFREGRLPMLFPTRTTLGSLAEFESLDALYDACRRHRVEPITPRLLIRGDSVRPVLPGDPDWDEAV
ncbi:MAG: NUDIX domain-containing protein [marine benthic group bacterium]|nr:NUDIX domain-containing protein [Candidatus Carthagonibacter metallireducens]MCL7991471.1 NUDIX domain-containing protein [Gemmatimonadota bacterium]